MSTEDEAPDAKSNRTVILGIIALFVLMLVLPVGGLLGYGLFLPDEYVTVVSGVIDAEPEALYETLADVDRQGNWRPGVTEVTPVDSMPDTPTILVVSGGTELVLTRTEARPPQRVVWEVVPSKKHVFQGMWAYELREEGAGRTRVTVTERGIIDSPFARGVTHALFGVDQYARASIKTLARAHDAAVRIDQGME